MLRPLDDNASIWHEHHLDGPYRRGGGGYFIRTRLNLGRAGDQAGISSKSAEEANIALAFSVGSLASWWVVSMKN